MSLRHFLTALAVLTWALVPVPEAAAQPADIIVSNGRILTVDPEFSIVHSLAIDDGRIVAVGSAGTVARHKGPNTRIIELGGKTVIPGLIDNHFHFIRGVWNYQREVRLDGVMSRARALAMIAARAKSAPKGQWITVLGGWSPGQFRDEPGGFTLAELDAAAPDNPVYIQQSYRTAYANSVALKAVGRDPAEGARMRGRQSFRPFGRFIGWRNKSSSKEAILTYMAALNRVGLTTVYDIGRPSEGKLAPLASLAAAGPIPLRVFHTLRYRAIDPESTDHALKLITDGTARPFSATDQFGVIGLGEHIYGPMHDRANRRERWEDSVWGPVRTISRAAARHGWPIHEHTMSGPTISQFIDLVEEIAFDTPEVKELRWTLAHSLGITEPDLNRARELGVAVAVHSQAMMNSRSRNRPPLGSIERSGVLWGLGSDGAIVAPINPFLTLGWAVTGLNIAGQRAWSEEQRVSRKAALIAHTINNAKLLFKEKSLGSLETGKLADLVVLDRDYLTVPPDEIAAIRPVLTMTGGRIAFEEK